MKQTDILTKSFKGSIDELLAHCDANANFVQSVMDGTSDVTLTDDEVVAIIKHENPELTDAQAKEVLTEWKHSPEHIAEAQKAVDHLVELGLLEQSGFREGEPTYRRTPLGTAVAELMEKGQL